MEIILFGLLAVLLVFMIFNTRRRSRQMKAEQEEKATKTIPGAKVLMQGGLYGTIVAFDPENLDEPALVEIAPGTIIEVHSQAILRVIEPKNEIVEEIEVDEVEDDALEDGTLDESTRDDEPDIDTIETIETPEETRARLDRDSDGK